MISEVPVSRRKGDMMVQAKPFLKWAGGKTQLIPAIEQNLPKDFGDRELTYVEPFVGSGAVLFWMLGKFPNIKTAVINDVNEDLINTYKVIKGKCEKLIAALQDLQNQYYASADEDARKQMFLDIRERYNSRTKDKVMHSAYLIFLNRTCFNGLYRVNSKNQFNVPFGKHSKPTICNAENLRSISKVLQRVTILLGDYAETIKHVNGDSFFYFDPPYKPISQTATFNAYARDVFDDDQQKRLKGFCDYLSANDVQWMLSNSDPKNNNPEDSFFDELYAGYRIQRIKAKRAINSVASRRGEINELLITNYK